MSLLPSLERTITGAVVQAETSLGDDAALLEAIGGPYIWYLELRAELLVTTEFGWRASELHRLGHHSEPWMQIRRLRAEHKFDGLLFPRGVVAIYDDVADDVIRLRGPVELP